MDSCAYCFKKEKLTREHVIPKFLYNFMKSCGGNQSGFNIKSNNIIKSEVTIKDVCCKCNNSELSKLDNYGKEFFKENDLLVCEYTKNQATVNYNHDILLRWLLKISYNSFRAAHKNKNIYTKYINYIIKGTLSSDSNNIYLLIEMLSITSNDENHNKFSVFLSEEMELNDYLTLVTVRIGILCFYIAIFKLKLKNSYKKKILKRFIHLNGKKIFILNKNMNKITINKSKKSWEDFINLRYPIKS